MAVGRLRWLTDKLAGASPPEDSVELPARSAIRVATLGCLERWRGDADAALAAIALESIGDYVLQLDALCESLHEPVAKAVTARRIPWWR